MYLSFEREVLRDLCNSTALLTRRYGPSVRIVQRRLLTLWNAPKLRDVAISPPDRRRLEPSYGPRAFSVCARDAGRIYFKVCSYGKVVADNIEDADSIEIFAIGDGSH